HALRAFTPKDQKAVKTAADTFRANPEFKVDQVITELAVGEALISCLDEKGIPQIVERGWVMPPHSSFTPISLEERKALMQQSIVAGIYEQPVDRDSATKCCKTRWQNASNRLRPPNLPNSKARNRKLLPSSKSKNR